MKNRDQEEKLISSSSKINWSQACIRKGYQLAPSRKSHHMKRNPNLNVVWNVKSLGREL